MNNKVSIIKNNDVEGWIFRPTIHNVGQKKVETSSNSTKKGPFINIGLMTSLLLTMSPTQGSVLPSSVGIEQKYILESTNKNTFLVFDGKEFVMSENLKKQTFDVYKDFIHQDIQEIKSDIKGLASKEDLATLEGTLLTAIKESKSSFTTWVLRGIVTVLLGFLGYLFVNPDKAINIFRAINGN